MLAFFTSNFVQDQASNNQIDLKWLLSDNIYRIAQSNGNRKKNNGNKMFGLVFGHTEK